MPNGRVAILFDIDGTLITSGGAGTRAWALAFGKAYGKEVDIGEFSDVGMTDAEVGQLSFKATFDRDPTQDEIGQLLELHQSFLPVAVEESQGYKVLDGAEELLSKLILDGYLLGLVSGNTEKGAHIKLHRANLNRFFSFGGYGSDSTDRSELTNAALAKAELTFGARIQLSQFLSVGDTPRDVEAAHSVGIQCVGVASHKFSVNQLAGAGADYVVGSLREGLPL